MRFDKFPGLVLDKDPADVGFDGLVVARNIDISQAGKISRRRGYTSFYAGAIDAAWGDGETTLFVEGSVLKQLQADGSSSVVASLTASTKLLSACRAYGNRLYWTTGIDYGVIESGVNRRFGVLKPSSVLVSTEAGALPDASYLVALSYVDVRGVEGPMSYSWIQASGGVRAVIPHSVLELAANDVASVRLYLSNPDGAKMYRAGEVQVGEASSIAYVGATLEFGVPEENATLSNMVLDGRIAEHGNRLWCLTRSVEGGFVTYTEPYSEMTNAAANFFAFASEGTALGSVSGGLYVGTQDSVFFLNGDDPGQMQASKKTDYGVIPGTMVAIDGRLINEEVRAKALMWASPRGICVGFPDGEVVNLTQGRVSELTGHAGAAILRQEDGQNHFLSVIRS